MGFWHFTGAEIFTCSINFNKVKNMSLKNKLKKYNFHIVSGSEHNELNNICKNFKLNYYFLSIDGSPAKKNDLVKKIINQYGYNREEVALIGDAMSDYNASIENGIRFYGYNNIKLKSLDYYIDTFNGLKVWTLKSYKKNTVKIKACFMIIFMI